MKPHARYLLCCLAAATFLCPSGLRAEEADSTADPVKKGLAALAKMQDADGHWGNKFPVAVTSISALAILAGEEEPFKNEGLWKAYAWLLTQQKDGDFRGEGHTWLHSQGFATLFLAELYGRALLAKDPPPQIKLDELKKLVADAADLVARAQSDTGGWFYQKAAGTHEHEGSTTVCAVQALRAAKDYGIPVPKSTLDKGFAYLKETQRPDGGFEYQKGSGSSMVAGTAGALATLVFMQKLDEKVLMEAMKFLATHKVEGLLKDRFPDYALFYTMMSMSVIHEEYGDHKPEALAWIPEIRDAVIKLQKEDGTWANTGWMGSEESSAAYATGFYVMTLAGGKGRLSIFHRDPPELPEK
ncbi:MAG: terpene cyclase/mutase family protein [Planctomycetes bacterium]|nr:terpene cyclase/mutase family protein [Planctomycetota bacterium]